VQEVRKKDKIIPIKVERKSPGPGEYTLTGMKGNGKYQWGKLKDSGAVKFG
jgi:hypothetical protein